MRENEFSLSIKRRCSRAQSIRSPPESAWVALEDESVHSHQVFSLCNPRARICLYVVSHRGAHSLYIACHGNCLHICSRFPVRHVSHCPQHRHSHCLGQKNAASSFGTWAQPCHQRRAVADSSQGLPSGSHCCIPLHSVAGLLGPQSLSVPVLFFKIFSPRQCLSSFLLSLSCFPFDMPLTSTFLHHRRVSQKELGLII